MAVQSASQAGFSALGRDPEGLRAGFERWLAARQAGAAVATANMPDGSTETVLVDAGWDGEAHRLVVRLASTQRAGPVNFETRSQYLTLRRLRTQVARPAVPPVLWCEDDPTPLGAPFFVMARVEGRTADENDSPYTFGSWITEASRTDRERMQRATLEQLARVHAAAPSDFAFLDRRRPGESALSTLVRQTAEQYESVCSRGLQAPIIERAFAWLGEHWPDETAPVLCWGDARIENATYRDFEPVALQRWEHATLGPRELDLGAMLFYHRFVDDLAHNAGRPGLPDFLHPTDVAATYADLTGYRPANLDFYIAYAALQHAIETVRSPLRTNAFHALTEALVDER